MGPPLAWGHPSWKQTWLGVGVWPRVPWVRYRSGALPAHGWSVVTVVSFMSLNGLLFGLIFSFLFHFVDWIRVMHRQAKNSQTKLFSLIQVLLELLQYSFWSACTLKAGEKCTRNSYFFQFFLSFVSFQRYLILPLLLLLFLLRMLLLFVVFLLHSRLPPSCSPPFVLTLYSSPIPYVRSLYLHLSPTPLSLLKLNSK